MVFVHQVKSDTVQGGASKRDISGRWGWGLDAVAGPALTIRTADLQLEWRGTGACNISILPTQQHDRGSISI
jgi:hypothetical protein